MRGSSKVAVIFLSYWVLCSSMISGVFIEARPGRYIPEWTLAVYMDSDNNLDYYAQQDLVEMMVVGSTAEVSVVVLWDSLKGPAYAYRVLPGGVQVLDDFPLCGVEVNMGDPEILRSWVSYTRTKFGSRKYALLCWDHGDDFRGCMFDEHVPEAGFDLLTHQEIVRALTGIHVDVLVYGACVMQEIEVSYEYYAGGLSIDYIVANEGYDPMDGFPYDSILANLVSAPSQTPLDFSKMLVDEYLDYYEYTGKAFSQAVTLSVVQISAVGEVVTSLRYVTEAIMMDMDGYADIVSSASGRANLPWSQNGWERLIDLPTFVGTIREKSLNPRETRGIEPGIVQSVVSAAEKLLGSLNAAVVYHRNIKAMEKKSCLGIGIYFPTSQESYEHNKQLYGDLYPLMAFSQQGWRDFLFSYWSVP